MAAGSGLSSAFSPSTTSLDLSKDSPLCGSELQVLVKALRHNPAITAVNLKGALARLGGEAVREVTEALRSNTAVIELSLAENGLSEARHVAELVRYNSVLTSLDVSRNFGSVGTALLCRALQGNASLRSLRIKGEELGEDGGSGVGELLARNRTLTSLNLGSCADLGPEGAVELAQGIASNASLRALSLKGTDIQDKGATAIARVLVTNTSLQFLNLMENRIRSEGFCELAKALRSNRTLTRLKLSDRMDAVSARNISAAVVCSNALRSLKLEGCYLEPVVLQQLTSVLQSPSLLELNLYDNNEIGPEGAAIIASALASNRTLTSLNLTYSCMEQSGAVAIAGAIANHPALRKFVAQGVGIQPEGGKAFAEALRHNTALRELDITDNGLGEIGGTALAEAMRVNSTLQSLSIGDERYSDAVARAFCGVLQQNRSLSFVDLRPSETYCGGKLVAASSISPALLARVAELAQANRAQAAIGPGDSASCLSRRVQDVAREPLSDLAPILGVIREAADLTLDAALALVDPPPVDADLLAAHLFHARQRARRPDGIPSDVEAGAAIVLYTDEDAAVYRRCNEALRDRDRKLLRQQWAPYVKLLLRGLRQLPPYRGTVYRGVRSRLGPQYSKLDPPEVFWNAFSSCTTNVKTLENQAFLGTTGDRTLFAVECETGRCISALSAFAKEEEVLLPPSVLFRVMGVVDVGGGLTLVQLKELPRPGALL